MKNIIRKSLLLIGTASCAFAMEAKNELQPLEIRNASTMPATFLITYHIPEIDDVTSMLTAQAYQLDPISDDGIQDKLSIPNLKKFGRVTVKVNNVLQFSHIVDLCSEIVVSTRGNVLFDFHYPQSIESQPLPKWLGDTITFTKFDLATYARNLSQKWNMLTTEERLTPYYFDIPSCVHVIDKEPTVIVPDTLKYCVKPGMKSAALTEYRKTHPEIDITEDEIRQAEEQLLSHGVPIIKH